MPFVLVSGTRPRASEDSLAVVLQTYTGIPYPDAIAAVRRIVGGDRHEVELEDEFAAYELASLLNDLGLQAEIDASF
jgi:hypothetical protein